MIENDETCKVAFRMAALEEMIAERIEQTLPASTIQEGTAPWHRKQTAEAARLRSSELFALAMEYCDVQDVLEGLDAEGSLQ